MTDEIVWVSRAPMDLLMTSVKGDMDSELGSRDGCDDRKRNDAASRCPPSGFPTAFYRQCTPAARPSKLPDLCDAAGSWLVSAARMADAAARG